MNKSHNINFVPKHNSAVQYKFQIVYITSHFFVFNKNVCLDNRKSLKLFIATESKRKGNT